jgi:hypothetical protein
MLYFPQLETGSAVQFPCTKRVRQRTVVNALADGSEAKLFDPGASRVEWQIELAALTSAEWTAMAALFEAAEGQLGTFLFLDPFGNLLKWSEDLSAAAWVKDSILVLTPGVADPLGGAQATRVSNTAGADRNIAQPVAAPSWYQYCLSLYARSNVGGHIALFVNAGGESAQQSYAVGPAWTRVALSARLATQQEAVTFGVTIPGGAAVELFGFQAEPQMGASSYKTTGAQCGVYPNASFLDDTLAMTSEAPGIFSCPVRIGS